MISHPGKDYTGDQLQDMWTDRIDDVANAYIHALLARHPKARYLVGKDAHYIWIPIGCWLPEWLGDAIFAFLARHYDPVPAAALKLK